jgi:4-amino-4-deoxy-L-arabinose transferase-like glycosyltransferase
VQQPVKWQRPFLLLILLIAAALRLVGLNNVSPPGLAHDEVANWLIDRSILAGNHAIYFTEAYGHEAGFHYLQTLFIWLLGDHALALRLPAAFCGLLLVAVCYAVNRRLFGARVALISMALLAFLLWPVMFSRQALRAISLPLLSGLSAYFWWGGWRAVPHRGRGRVWPFLLAGLMAGLSFHTYMAARAVPIFYGLFLLYLALAHRSALRARWRGVAGFVVIYALVAAPLVVYLLSNPGAEFRIEEVSGPLTALWAGDLGPVLHNGWLILGLFGWVPDPLWRQGVPHLPVFEPVTAVFFYLGLLLCLWRIRDARYAFVLLWLAVAAVPSLVTINAPSTIRMINALPFLTLPAAQLMHSFPRLSTVIPNLSTVIPQFSPFWRFRAAAGLLLLLLLANVWRTGYATFVTWPQDETEVRFVWQAALTEAAGYLDESGFEGAVAVGGWTPETMDPPTMELTLRRDDLSLRYFHPAESLIVPDGGERPSLIIHPAILAPHPALAERLLAWGAVPGGALPEAGAVPRAGSEFRRYELAAGWSQAVLLQQADGTVFGDELVLLGYEWLSNCREPGLCEMLSVWRVLAPSGEARRFFWHVLDEGGALLGQHDGLGAPAAHWQPGDIVVQWHGVWLEAAVSPTFRLGVYDPQTCVPGPCQNVPTETGDPYAAVSLPNLTNYNNE